MSTVSNVNFRYFNPFNKIGDACEKLVLSVKSLPALNLGVISYILVVVLRRTLLSDIDPVDASYKFYMIGTITSSLSFFSYLEVEGRRLVLNPWKEVANSFRSSRKVLNFL